MLLRSIGRTLLGVSASAGLVLATLTPAAHGQACAVPARPAASDCIPDIFSPGPMVPPGGSTTTPLPTAPDFAEGGRMIARGGNAFEAGSANMFGDDFGTRRLRAVLAVPFGGPLVPRQSGDVFFATAPNGPNTYGPGKVTFTNASGFTVQGLVFPALTFTNSQALPFPVASGSVPLFNQPALQQALLAQAQKQFGPATQLVGGSTVATLVPAGYIGVETQQLMQSPFDLSVRYTAQTELLIPTPTGGGVVGRTKISDDNSPLPRDRVIFDYDYYNNVPLSFGGTDVHRFTVGVEKTFFDGMMSLEVRVPFASTLSSDVTTNGFGSDRAELGDVHFTLKALLYGGPNVKFAAGLGIDVPTGDDVRVFDTFGHELLRVKNESFVLTPYIAYLVTPTDRVFFQNWVEYGFVTNGNPVSANLDLSGLQGVGRLDDQSLCQIDAQLGYWLFRRENNSALLRGLAPFVELHYNATLGNADQLQVAGSSIGAETGHVDELNLSAGCIALIGDRLQLAVGAVVPLRGNNDRSFDWQIGVHGNYFFGPAARARSQAAMVSGF